MKAPSVRRTQLPRHSALHDFVGKSDFLDCYAVAAGGDMPIRDVAERLTDFPEWTRGLMALRNAVVSPFGLTTEVAAHLDTIGMFPVESETEDEIVAGFDDRHLNFRISILRADGLIHLATWVHPHNIGGHLYLAAVMPFHVLIIRDALKRLAAHETGDRKLGG